MLLKTSAGFNFEVNGELESVAKFWVKFVVNNELTSFSKFCAELQMKKCIDGRNYKLGKIRPPAPSGGHPLGSWKNTKKIIFVPEIMKS